MHNLKGSRKRLLFIGNTITILKRLGMSVIGFRCNIYSWWEAGEGRGEAGEGRGEAGEGRGEGREGGEALIF